MNTTLGEIGERIVEHPLLSGGILAGAVGVCGAYYLFRRWVAGGVCRSQARLDGKTVIITGANSGIGLETAVDLAKRNARVILACRSVERGETAAVEVRKRSGNDNAVFVQLDLASLDSVRKFAAKILEEEPRIDILINNAGVISGSYKETPDGFESTFAVNHLGHFLLTNLLLDRIKEAPSARIVNVGAKLFKHVKKFDFDNINSKDPSRFKGMLNAAYVQSKLANVLFTLGLDRHLKGTNVTVNVLHPGVIRTELLRDYPVLRVSQDSLIIISLACRPGPNTHE
jgi:retinol dehydrogenase-13